MFILFSLYTHIYIHIHKITSISLSLYTFMYVCMYACMYVCMYVCIHTEHVLIPYSYQCSKSKKTPFVNVYPLKYTVLSTIGVAPHASGIRGGKLDTNINIYLCIYIIFNINNKCKAPIFSPCCDDLPYFGLASLILALPLTTCPPQNA